MTESPPKSPHLPVAYDNICDFSEWAGLKVDTDKFDSLLGRLDAADGAEGGGGIKWAQDRILRASAFETGAVEDLYAEGATYSVAMEVDGWEEDLANSGDGAGKHFDDQLAAYVAVRELALDDGSRPLLEVHVRGLHSIATRSQQTYPVRTSAGLQQQKFVGGAYKTKANQVINRAGQVFHYAPVEEVAPEMERLVETMRSETYLAAHPVIQCAYVHWAVSHIHPFSDGNGRMARVIGSIPLLKAYGIPLVVFAGRKRLYLQALEAADRHTHQEMVDYTAARALETYSWLAELIEGASAEAVVDNVLVDINRLVSGETEALETSREAAQRLETTMVEALKQECAKRFSGTPILSEVTVSYSSELSRFYGRSDDFRRKYSQLEYEVRISLSIEEVADLSTSEGAEIGFTDAPGVSPIVIVHDLSSSHDVFFSLEDCSPNLSVGADLRLRIVAGTVVAKVAKRFHEDLKGVYKQHGRLPSDNV